MGANLFSGEIPPELGSLSSFQIAMNLSFNNFTGRIPPALGNLNLLEFLLLNNNHLTGEIPSTFESLSSLLGCNFSYNDLTGALPSTPLFQNMDISSFIGNKGLCGGSLGGCNVNSSPQSVPSLESGVTHRSKIVTVIAAAVGGVSLILIAVILYFMRRPGQRVPFLQYKDALSPDTDMYLPAKEGFTFQDLVEATNNFHESYVIGRGACGIVYKAVNQVRCIKDEDGKVLATENAVKDRWRGYFHNLFNEGHERSTSLEELSNSEECRNYSFYRRIRKEEVVVALKKMKHRKAVGPDDIPIEVWKVLGETGIAWLTDLFNRILKTKKMPNEW
ncbi:probable leucine-rich repeat receptor-like protein kinase At2g33170 [Malus sylvestris]|uniref:probable leucine-rich repeat receptor-like protein kinase At2g33170 n=1 Tax=Malus sylvestris TaxID=3752 RepID=UPI0021AC2CCF|nr:probable leucine-rich repeat receptor-like protein kinase At2g33170 [Malus sylvestris]